MIMGLFDLDSYGNPTVNGSIKNGVAIASGATAGLIFIRLKADSYEGTVNLRDVSVLTTTSGDTGVLVLFNPTWTGAALTFTDVI